MKSTYLQNFTAFLCITGSLVMIESDHKRTDALPLTRPRSATSPIRQHPVEQSVEPSWLGKPTNELEAQIYFYMQPTAKEVNQRKQYAF